MSRSVAQGFVGGLVGGAVVGVAMGLHVRGLNWTAVEAVGVCVGAAIAAFSAVQSRKAAEASERTSIRASLALASVSRPVIEQLALHGPSSSGKVSVAVLFDPRWPARAVVANVEYTDGTRFTATADAPGAQWQAEMGVPPDGSLQSLRLEYGDAHGIGRWERLQHYLSSEPGQPLTPSVEEERSVAPVPGPWTPPWRPG